MARTLIHEEQRQQILDADALPLARVDYQVPNYSAAGKSIFAALSEKDEAGDRIADQRKGELDAGKFQIGKDEAGNYVQVPAPKGSAAYQAGYYNAIDNRFDAHFSSDLNNSFNAIQNDPNLDATAKLSKMQAALEGTLKSAPDQYKARWETTGRSEITQRGVLIAQQAAKDQEKLIISDTQAALSRAEDELSSVAAAGGPTLKQEMQIDKHVDALVGIGAMGKAEGEIHKKAAREYGYGVALSRRVTNDVLAAKNDPDAVLEFGIKLENGGEAQINVTTYKPGPDGNMHPVLNTLSTTDVLKRLPSPKLRAAVATNIKEAARQFKSEAQAYAKNVEFQTWVTTQGGNSYRSLPAHLKDEFGSLVEQHVAAGAMDTPEGRQKISGLIKLTKVIPDIIAKNLSLELNGSDEKFHKAAAFIHDLRTAIGPDGGAVGDHIVQGLPEDLRNLVSAVELGIEYGHPLPEIRKAIQNQADPNGVSVGDAIELFNRNKTLSGQKFAASTKNQFQQLTGLSDLPPEAESDVQRLFHLHFLASRNADAAHTKAVKEVARSYVKSEVFLGGYAKTHQLPLTNPTGYKTGKTLAYFRDTGYEWLNENISKNLVETATDLTPADLAHLRATNQPLGSSVFLQPTDTALERPQFEVWFKDKNGEVRPVHEKTSNGMRPLIVDPGADRAMIEHKASVYDAAETLRKAVDNQVNVLRDKLLNVPGLAPPGAVGSIIKEEDLRRFADPEQLKKYNTEVETLEKGYREYIDKLEKDTGIDVPEGRVDHQSLMTPKLGGPEIVRQVASYIDELLPDGTNGAFLQRIAATESDFGRAGGTFRMKGDKGIWQINTGSAFVEVQRLIKQGKGRVFEAHQHIKSKTGIDLSKVSMNDLDKPLISGLFARLYFERKGSKIPNDVVGQARLWKDYYNTYLGTGTPGHFIRASGKVELAEALPAKGAPMKKPVYEKTWGEIWDELMDRQGWAEMYDKSITKAVFDNLFGESKRTEAFGGNPKDDFEGAMAILVDDYGMDLRPGALDDAPASDKIIDMRNWDDDKIAREGMVSLIQYALRTQELTNDYHSRRGKGPPIPLRKPANLKMVHAVSEFVLQQKQQRSAITDLLMQEGGNDQMTRKKKKKPLKVTIPGK